LTTEIIATAGLVLPILAFGKNAGIGIGPVAGVMTTVVTVSRGPAFAAWSGGGADRLGMVAGAAARIVQPFHGQ
ncbi:hypothetical protein ACWD95_42970, partial [Streptomyces sp. NPDC005069]